MKRIICFVLLAFMLCSILPISAFAESNMNTRDSNYFASYGVHLTRRDDGRIKIVFSASGTGMCDQIGVATYEIMEKDDNGNWDEFSGLLSGRTASNVQSYTFSKYFTPNEGKQYRVKCTFACTIGGSTEYKAYTSGTI